MKKHLLTVMAVLLCCLTASAQTYADWTSTNAGQPNSTSVCEYSLEVEAGNMLSFDWEVGSEESCDFLTAKLNGTVILNKSGVQSGAYQYTFIMGGTYTLTVEYTKDDSRDFNGDYAKVTNVFIGVASGTHGDNLRWNLSSDGTLRIAGEGEMPLYSEDYPWYEYRNEITKVTLCEGITSIGEYAFYEFNKITTVDIPEGVTSIENDAFYRCHSLTAITIPESVTSIGDGAFYGCSSLTEITIPEGVTSIGGQAFSGCSRLTAINIPESVTSIGEYPFWGCSRLTSITVDENNTAYDSRNNCNAIIETAGNILITGCSTTVIPKDVTSIGQGAFAGCTFTTINIPEGVTSIGSQAFYDCSRLTAINIPESVTSIGAYAFYGCNSLTEITIPEGVTSIGGYAFHFTAWYNNQLDGVVYLDGWIVCYKGTMQENTSVSILQGAKRIAGNAFSSCSSLLTSVTFPEDSQLTSIGDHAFYNCSSLTTINIPESVTSIGDKAFINCTKVRLLS